MVETSYDIIDIITGFNGIKMAALNVRNLPEDVHKALRVRAAEHGRSTEAEVRAILEAAVKPVERVKLGSLLAAIGKEFGGVDLNFERDQTPARAASFD